MSHTHSVHGRNDLPDRKLVAVVNVRVQRAYDPPTPADGTRVLVDRIWPRGLRKESAHLDHWVRDAAPSTELRTWYGHDPAKLDEFRRRYTEELAEPGPREALSQLTELARQGPVTLLTATKELKLSQATILADLLTRDQSAAPAMLSSDGAQANDAPSPIRR